MPDEIKIKIEEDGTITWETDNVSDVNHVSADNLLHSIEDVMGGQVDRRKKKANYAHIHQHLHNKAHIHSH